MSVAPADLALRLPLVDAADRGPVVHRFHTRGADDEAVRQSARALLSDVRFRGDAALLDAAERFDGCRPDPLFATDGELDDALADLEPALRESLELAIANVRRFHDKQRRESWFTEDGDGVVLGQRMVPVDRAGLYVPAGTAPLPSSLIMTAVAAQEAGVRELIVATPPAHEGRPHPVILGTARLLGVARVLAAGGAQAIGALAYGTETVQAVDVIVGPGNAYVAAAKREVFGRVGIDSVAGPSEIVVLADEMANPRFIATDLLSQAEHDREAAAVLVTPSRALAERVRVEVDLLLETLPRREQLDAALQNGASACIVTGSLEEAIGVVNELAPEHLEILCADPWAVMGQIRHAGAIFLGPYAPEPVGDYLAGPNHVLPTGGTARYASPLGVDTFMRRQSVIAYSARRLRETGPHIVRLAHAEGLAAHAAAITARLDTLSREALSDR